MDRYTPCRPCAEKTIRQAPRPLAVPAHSLNTAWSGVFTHHGDQESACGCSKHGTDNNTHSWTGAFSSAFPSTEFDHLEHLNYREARLWDGAFRSFDNVDKHLHPRSRGEATRHTGVGQVQSAQSAARSGSWAEYLANPHPCEVSGTQIDPTLSLSDNGTPVEVAAQESESREKRAWIRRFHPPVCAVSSIIRDPVDCADPDASTSCRPPKCPPGGIGSGALISRDLVLTNRHVVVENVADRSVDLSRRLIQVVFDFVWRGPPSEDVRQEDNSTWPDLGLVWTVNEVVDLGQCSYAFNCQHDWAILRVAPLVLGGYEFLPGDLFGFLRLRAWGVDRGASVRGIAHPHALTKRFFDNLSVVDAVYDCGEEGGSGRNCFLIDHVLQEGASGSPILDADGCVVGLYRAAYNDAEDYGPVGVAVRIHPIMRRAPSIRATIRNSSPNIGGTPSLFIDQRGFGRAVYLDDGSGNVLTLSSRDFGEYPWVHHDRSIGQRLPQGRTGPETAQGTFQIVNSGAEGDNLHIFYHASAIREIAHAWLRPNGSWGAERLDMGVPLGSAIAGWDTPSGEHLVASREGGGLVQVHFDKNRRRWPPPGEVRSSEGANGDVLCGWFAAHNTSAHIVFSRDDRRLSRLYSSSGGDWILRDDIPHDIYDPFVCVRPAYVPPQPGFTGRHVFVCLSEAGRISVLGWSGNCWSRQVTPALAANPAAGLCATVIQQRNLPWIEVFSFTLSRNSGSQLERRLVDPVSLAISPPEVIPSESIERICSQTVPGSVIYSTFDGKLGWSRKDAGGWVADNLSERSGMPIGWAYAPGRRPSPPGDQ